MTLSLEGRTVASRLFAVLGAFTAAHPGRSLTLTEIARHAGLPISTTHRLVAELVRCDALERGRDGRYTVGFRIWEIGVQTPAAQRLHTAALPYLEDLHGLAGDDIQLLVLDGDETVCVESFLGHASSGRADVSRREPARESAAGLVLLAHQEELVARATRMIGPELTQLDSRAAAQIRLEGIARRVVVASLAVAAPIRNREREVVAAVSVVYPASTATTRAYDDAIRVAARGISRVLGFENGPQRRATA